MSTDNTIQDASKKARVHTILSALIILIGLVLLIYMIRVESEPGALPLLLIVLGVGWWLITRARRRSRHG